MRGGARREVTRRLKKNHLRCKLDTSMPNRPSELKPRLTYKQVWNMRQRKQPVGTQKSKGEATCLPIATSKTNALRTRNVTSQSAWRKVQDVVCISMMKIVKTAIRKAGMMMMGGMVDIVRLMKKVMRRSQPQRRVGVAGAVRRHKGKREGLLRGPSPSQRLCGKYWG